LAILAVVAHTATTSVLAAGKSQELATVYGYQQAFLTAAGLIFISFLIAVFVIQVPKMQKKK